MTDYVPAAGLRWMAFGSPRQLATHESFRAAARAIFDPERLEAFVQTSGVDLRTVPSALVAGFDLGTLYMAELPAASAPEVRKLFEERLVSGAIVKQAHPELLRITGVVGQTPETLLTIGQRTIAVSVGDPTPARIAEAFARRRLKNSPSALRGSALSTLPDLSSATVSFFAPGPFPEDVHPAAAGLLEPALAVGAALRPSGLNRAKLEIMVSGDWSADPRGSSDRLLAVYRNLAESSTGQLLGLNQQPGPTARGTADLLMLEVELELEPIGRGIRAAVLADPSEIFGHPTKQPIQSPSPAAPVGPR